MTVLPSPVGQIGFESEGNLEFGKNKVVRQKQESRVLYGRIMELRFFVSP